MPRFIRTSVIIVIIIIIIIIIILYPDQTKVSSK